MIPSIQKVFVLCFFLDFHSSWAQTSVPTPTPAPTTTVQQPPITPPPAPPADPSGLNGVFPGASSFGASPAPSTSSGDSSRGSSSGATDTLLNMVGSISTGPGKYEEFQSICRENLYDNPAYWTSEVQQKRIDDIQEKIKLLKEYIDQRKRPEAEKLYAAIKAESSNEQTNKIADALHQFVQGEPNRAESTLSKLTIDDTKNTLALTYLAEIYTKNQKYFEAAAAYFDLVKLTKTSYDLQLCEIQTLDSQHSDAEKFCKKANQLLTNNPYPFIYMGISQRERLNYDEAIKSFKDSLRKKQTEMGFSCLGEIYFIKEKFSGAIELFKRALKIYPDSYRALLGMAWAQFKDKKTLDSLDSFKHACRLNRNVTADLRRAYKILSEEKSAHAKAFAEQAQKCTE